MERVEPDAAGPDRAAGRRPPGRLRAQPAALAVRARRVRPARPRVADLRPRHGLGGRVDARRPQAGAARPGALRPGRGRAGDEGRGHRVRGAHGAPRGRHLAQAARRAARRGLRVLPPGPPVGRRPRALAEVGGPRPLRARDERSPSTSRTTRSRAPRASSCATSPTPTARCARRSPRPRAPRTSTTSWPGSASSCARPTRRCSTSGRTSRTRPSSTRRARTRAPIDQGPPPVTRNERAFRVLVRNEMFRRVELFARRSPADLAALEDDGPSLGLVGRRDGGLLRRVPDPRRRSRRPRAGVLPRHRARAAPGTSARCSTTPRATTTGPSPPRSTSTPPTSSARPPCTSRPSAPMSTV